MEELYENFSRGIKYYLCRQLGAQELEDRVHDAFIVVIQSIRNGSLREPERLMGFVRTVVRRQVAARIEEVVQARRQTADPESGLRVVDRRGNPEAEAIRHQRTELMAEFLRNISDRDREILTRFYLKGETQEQICKEMHLTETQFRLLKSRAKGRFAEIGKKKLASATLRPFIVRKKRSGGH
jgi:RNA polymerase sigma factor (sigma-70 family)